MSAHDLFVVVCLVSVRAMGIRDDAETSLKAPRGDGGVIKGRLIAVSPQAVAAQQCRHLPYHRRETTRVGGCW